MEDFIELSHEAIGRICEKSDEISAKKHDYDTGTELTLREIHVIAVIAGHPGKNAGELAKVLGFPKGTFSKITQKLIEMGFISREHPEGDNKQICFHLTQSGEKAYEGHQRYHAERSIRSYIRLDRYSDGEKRTILDFLEQYNAYLDDYL